MAQKEPLFPGKVNSAGGAYTPGLAVGDLVFVARLGPVDPVTKQVKRATIEEQVEQTLKNVAAVLAEAGCTLDDCVKVTAHLADINDFHRYNAAYEKHFKRPYPTRTTTGSQIGGILVEIDAIA